MTSAVSRSCLRGLVVLSFFASLGGAGCSPTQRARFETAAAERLISDEDAIRLGEELHAELERQEEIRFVEDPIILGYAHELLERLAPAARADREGIPFRIFVLDNPEMINAFAAPGGYLYLTTGLLLSAENEAEVAGVLAHELGHVTARHIERRLVTQLGISAVQQMVLGRNPGALGEIAGQLAATGMILTYSRQDELEADRYGLRYAAEGGYDPRGLLAFFETIQEEQGDGPGVPAFLSTHPAPAQRIEEGQAYIEREDLATGHLTRGRLPQIQRRIRTGLDTAAAEAEPATP